MTTVLCLWYSLLGFSVAEDPTPAPDRARAAIDRFCPRVGEDAKLQYISAFNRRHKLTPESTADDVERVLEEIDFALGKVGTLPDCSPMHALRGSLYYELALRLATGEVDLSDRRVAGKAIHAYDPQVDYTRIHEALENAKQDLALAKSLENSGPASQIAERLKSVVIAINKVDTHITRRKKQDAAAAERLEAKQIDEVSRKARIRGGVAVVGGGVAGALGVTLLGRGLVVEDLLCSLDVCKREFRNGSLIAGSATSIASGALLGIGLHQLVRSSRLSKPNGPFPERTAGVGACDTSVGCDAITGRDASGVASIPRGDTAPTRASPGSCVGRCASPQTQRSTTTMATA